MSIPTSVEAVAIVVLLFIPGYIFLQFTKSAVAFVPQAVDIRYLFAVVTWGGLIHGAAAYWTLPLLDWYQDGSLRTDHAAYVIVWSVLTLIVIPLLAGTTGAWLIKQQPIDRLLASLSLDYVSRTPSAWNYAMKLGPRWVRVHLKDGTVIGGTYDDLALADDAGAKDLFLSQVYNLTKTLDFDRTVTSTEGVWIAHGEISHIMFFRDPTMKEGITDG